VDAATRRGIPVTNCPDVTALPTAEVAIGLLLSVARRIGEMDRKMRSGPPENLFGMGRFMGMRLQGRSLGIIGLGNIGGPVAEFGRLIGMEVAYHNRRRLPPAQERGARYLSLEELLQQSDVVSIHCPLTPATRNLLSARRLALMKPGAVLINTARGAIVDYEALARMIREEKLWGAGLDVFHQEPHVPEELLALDRVVLTPHIGTKTVEARNDMAQAAGQVEVGPQGGALFFAEGREVHRVARRAPLQDVDDLARHLDGGGILRLQGRGAQVWREEDALHPAERL